MKGEKIRVCQVLHGIVGGGSEQVVLNYCSRMRDIHFDLLYQYEPNPQILERFNEAGINCIRIPDKVHHPLKHLWAMFRIFRKGHYDVVHSHLDWFMNSYVCLLAMFAGIKKRIAHHHQAYTFDCHLGLRAGISLSFKKGLCSILRIPCKLFATHWLACGEAAAINGWGRSAFKRGDVTILPNAIDPERFMIDETARREIRAKYGIKEDDFVIGHVGRFYPQKNHEFLIDVFAEFHKRKAKTRLLLLGEGPLQEHIKQKVESLGLTKIVIFAGLQKDPAPFYSAMDVFVFPSLWEGLPLTLVEAQYAGLPCVVSENVTRDVVISEQCKLIKEFDSNLWCESLECSFGVRKGLNSVFSSHYDINKAYGHLNRIYKENVDG
ncbi:glycosyltransferase EpsF [Fibrobacter sp. UWB8]|uniref:glycosyltransferase n=1 Tax=Fibrobacter sp. UWB8 TaxID=1896207 RepID=UPI0009120E94|nr:glycosyltransferase [Fibrobacter sp. UWB8]SHG37656.1 glycosyltransferase EpsF [Fibrobacter sp. UWB8]